MRYLKDLKFNFTNFFAFFITSCCFFVWFYIVMRPIRADNPHIAEVRTYVGNILILVIGYFFGSSKATKESKDQLDNIHNQIKSYGKDNETKTETPE